MGFVGLECATLAVRDMVYGVAGKTMLGGRQNREAFELQCYRRMLYINCVDHLSKTEAQEDSR